MSEALKQPRSLVSAGSSASRSRSSSSFSTLPNTNPNANASTALISPPTPSSSSTGSMTWGEDSATANVRVILRVRPLAQHETTKGMDSVLEVVNKTELVVTVPDAVKPTSKTFAFDQVCGPQTSQEQLFRCSGVTAMIDSAIDGFSATIFAYGQTGSGKTHSMSGSEDRLVQGQLSPDTDGVIPRSAVYLFHRVAQRQRSDPNLRILVRASYAEIHNEVVRDLLNTENQSALPLRWNAEHGFFVENQVVVECSQLDDLIAVIAEGHLNRRVGSHELNVDSSRSHCMLTIHIESELVDPGDGHARSLLGKLTFVDLAGSERLKETKSAGEMRKETGQINKSLFTLGKVISTLCDIATGKKPRDTHVPYRDSTLSKLLMDSLGGNGLCLMIACCSPASAYLEETTSTLNYASRARNIKNKPSVHLDPREKLILQLRQEIRVLKLENSFLHQQLGTTSATSSNSASPIPSGFALSGSAPSSRLSSPMPPGSSHGQLSNQIISAAQKFAAPPASMTAAANADPSARTLIAEMQETIRRLRIDLDQSNSSCSLAERQFRAVMFENQELHKKIENLEHVFLARSTSAASNRSATPSSASAAPSTAIVPKLPIPTSSMHPSPLSSRLLAGTSVIKTTDAIFGSTSARTVSHTAQSDLDAWVVREREAQLQQEQANQFNQQQAAVTYQSMGQPPAASPSYPSASQYQSMASASPSLPSASPYQTPSATPPTQAANNTRADPYARLVSASIPAAIVAPPRAVQQAPPPSSAHQPVIPARPQPNLSAFAPQLAPHAPSLPSPRSVSRGRASIVMSPQHHSLVSQGFTLDSDAVRQAPVAGRRAGSAFSFDSSNMPDSTYGVGPMPAQSDTTADLRARVGHLESVLSRASSYGMPPQPASGYPAGYPAQSPYQAYQPPAFQAAPYQSAPAYSNYHMMQPQPQPPYQHMPAPPMEQSFGPR